jgi:DNA polymerase-4
VKELFDKLYERRMLIRLVGVRFSYLVGGGYQINLFEDSLEQIHLYQAVDQLKKRFGDDAIMRAAGMGFHLRDFNPFNGIRKGAASGVQKKEMTVA